MLNNKKTALVTWWASGIWREIVKELLKNNIRVCINYHLSKKNLEDTKIELKKIWWDFIFIKADISNESEVKKMFDKISKEFWSLDYLINNAWIWWEDQKIMDQTIDHWEMVIKTNLTWKFLCTKHSISLLSQSENAIIINISSRLWNKPLYGTSAYCCSAAWINMLSKISALEFASKGIRVNTISPWFSDTPMTRNLYPKKEKWNIASKNNPSWRVWLPQDIANAVLFLISEKSNYINWANIDINWWSTLL